MPTVEDVPNLVVGSTISTICHLAKNARVLRKGIPEEFSMSAVDMSMIDHIPDMIENGVDSLKIEGRMKSIHYVSTVTNCYKAAVDAYWKVLRSLKRLSKT